MIFAPFVIGVVLIAIWAVLFISRRRRWRARAVPSEPQPFGYSMAWLAVDTRDTALLIEALGLSRVEPAVWSKAVGEIYAPATSLHKVLVTPPVRGWSLVAGLALPMPMGKAYQDVLTQLLVDLSEEFGTVQFFVSYPDLSLFGWARATDGALCRGFAVGTEGVIWNKGSLTSPERAACGGIFELREVDSTEDESALSVEESTVLDIARDWSVDPTSLSGLQAGEAGTVYLGVAPSGWRPRLNYQPAA